MSSRERGLVLVIEDEGDLRSLLRDLLEDVGFAVEEAADGQSGLRRFHADHPSLIILDVAMPRMDGWTTLERIRELCDDVPVLMLTARAAELEKVRGLRAGADDYVTKPFGRQELLARIEALLRRAETRATELDDRYADALIQIDFRERSIRVDGREVVLTPLEFKLLATFVRHPRQVLAREQLLELVWHDPYAVSPDQVRLYVGYLRRKLGLGGDDSPIETVRGFGYRYRPAVAL